jgi:uncharacterized repeat protein (TIGR01451 family)
MSNLLRLLILASGFLLFLPLRAQELDTTMWVTNGTVYATAKNKNTLYLGGEFTYVGPNTGGGATIVPASGRLVSEGYPKIEGIVFEAIPDGKGGYFIAGDFRQISGIVIHGVAHILPDGSHDKAWRAGGMLDQYGGLVQALALHNGVLYAGGYFNRVDGQLRNNLAAFDAGTGQLLPWNPDASSSVRCLAVAGDAVFAGGSFTQVGGVPKARLAAIDALTGKVKDWNLDVSIDPNLPLSNTVGVEALAVRGSTLYVGGRFDKIGPVSRSLAAAVDAATGQVTDWQPAVTGLRVSALATADTLVYLGGYFTAVNGLPRSSLAAVSAATGIPSPWAPGITPVRDYAVPTHVFDLAAYAGSVYIAGLFTKVGSQERQGVAQLDGASGAVTPWNLNQAGGINTFAFSGTGTMYAGGSSYSIGGQKVNRLAAINTATGRALPWNAGTNGTVRALAIRENVIYLGGDFTKVNNQNRSFLAAVDVATGRLSPWNPAPNGKVKAMTVSGNNVVFSGDFWRVGQQARTGLAAADGGTGQLTSLRLNHSGTIHSLAAAAGTVYVGGNFTRIDGVYNPSALLALDAAGKAKPLLSSGPAETWTTYCVRVVNGKLFAGGYLYAARPGEPRTYHNLIMLDLNTGQPLTWGNSLSRVGFSSTVYAFDIVGDTVYVGGVFGCTAFSLVDGESTGWQPIPDRGGIEVKVAHLAAYDNAVYVGGPFFYVKQPNEAWHNKTFYFAAFGKPVRYGNTISGRIYEDTNRNCIQDPGEKPLAGIMVAAEPGPYFASSDQAGNYSIPVDTGRYTVRQLLANTPYAGTSQLCPANGGAYEVAFKSFGNTSSDNHFGNQVNPQPLLTVEVASSRRRRCAASITSVHYANGGGVAAEGVQVHVQLPPYVVLLGSAHPHTHAGGNHYIFDVGRVDPGVHSTIQLTDSVVCGDASIRGLTQCTRVWVTPVNARNDAPGWDGSDLAVRARCRANGLVRCGIYNTGTGAMGDSTEYRLFVDAELALKRRFKLAPGDSLVFQLLANGRTIRLEADQRPNHPVKQVTSVTLEACGTNAEGKESLGFVNQLPPDDSEPEVAEECLPITDSFDPNDKLVRPAGTTPQRYTPTGTSLAYTVRFQNTGTDYAYRVVVVDTLSSDLDIRTLQLGAASHPYQFTVSGKDRPVLTWTFDNIELPDSTRNPAGSNGFVRFNVTPRQNLPLKARIENAADIFFDYNEPVRTNTVLNTIYDVPREIAGGDAITINACGTNTVIWAGRNRSFCEQDTVKLAALAPIYGKGRWKNIQGAGRIEDPDNPLSVVTHLSYGENVFEWSFPVNTCTTDSLRARITVSRLPAPPRPVIQLLGADTLRASAAADAYAWFFNGTLLPQLTRWIAADRAGSYTVQLQSGGCLSPLSEPFAYTITGVAGPVADPVSVHPNPNNGHFFIGLPAAMRQEVAISLVDATGRTIRSHFFGEYTNREWDFSEQKPGFYLVVIKTRDQLRLQKCIIQR